MKSSLRVVLLVWMFGVSACASDSGSGVWTSGDSAGDASGAQDMEPGVDLPEGDQSLPDIEAIEDASEDATPPADTETPKDTEPPEDQWQDIATDTPEDSPSGDTPPTCPTEPECEPLWSSTCQGSTGYKICGLEPETGCPAEGFFISCAYGNSCEDDLCGGACVIPEVMLVVDRSSSMEGPVWEFTKDTLTSFAEAYQEGIKLGVRPFPGDDGCAPGATVPMSLDNAAAIPGSLVEPAVSSSTPIGAALDDIEVHFGDPGQGEYVILLSDGSETCGAPDDALQEAQTLRSRGTTVHVVGLGYGYDEALLSAIAEAGGGIFQTAQDAAELAAALRELSATMIDCEQPADGLAICDAGECILSCLEGSHPCGDLCGADDDPANCGAECVDCPGDPNGAPTCDDGACGVVCDEGWHACEGACASDDDPTACGTECLACPGDPNGDPTCEDGACGLACDPGWHLCGDACAADDDATACGPGCIACPGDPHGDPACLDAVCGLDCESGWLDCGDGCAACPADPHGYGICDGVTCALACSEGWHLCGGACSADDDPDACGETCEVCEDSPYGDPVCVDGGCGVECAGGALFCAGDCAPCPVDPKGYGVCAGASCVLACDPGWHACGDACVADDDPDACGAACELCPVPANATATCLAGDCGFECLPSALPCGPGCAACPPEINGVATCQGSFCVLDCEPDFHLCGDLCTADDDPNACGALCALCPGTANGAAVCDDGVCGLSCEPGHLLCDGSCPACPDPGGVPGDFICWEGGCYAPCIAGTHFCEGACVADDSPDHCGDLCAPCPALGDAVPTCEDGTCGFYCPPGTAVCDDGCCSWLHETVDTDTSTYGASKMNLFLTPTGDLAISYHNSDKGRIAIETGGTWSKQNVVTGNLVELHGVRLTSTGWGAGLSNMGYGWDLATKPPGGVWSVSDLQASFTLAGALERGADDVVHLAFSRSDWPPHVYYRSWDAGALGGQEIVRNLADKQTGTSLDVEVAADGTVWVGISEKHLILQGNVWKAHSGVVVAHKAPGDAGWTAEEVTGFLEGTGRCDLAVAADGTPHVAWTRGTQAYHAVRGPGGAWTTEVAWNDVHDLQDASLALDPEGEPHIAYVHKSGSWHLVHVHQSGGAWSHDVVELVDGLYTGERNDILVLPDGRVAIAYRYAGTISGAYGSNLRLATTVAAP